ncbi:MAG TPA: hypothetical protein VEU62_14825 [Bryobacterales bacterium]|nr:hypothetical protein [Bryobacterales bacterium]
MKRERVAAILAAAVLLGWQLRTRRMTVTAGAAPPAQPPEAVFLIRFGLTHPSPRPWDGSVSMTGGRVLALQGWQFADGDAVASDHSWKCATRQERYWYSPWERSLYPTKNEEKITAKGLLLKTTPGGRVTLRTPQGDFAFEPAEVTWAHPKEFAGGDVTVSRSPWPEPLTRGPAEEDYPALLEARDGTIWLAYQSYENGGDRLYVRRGLSGAPEALTPGGGKLFRSALAEDAYGGIWVVWSSEIGGNWDLYARRFDGRQWGKPERLTDAPGPDIFHTLAHDAQGRLYLAWQSFRDGQSDIYLRVYDGRRWGPEVRVSDGPADDWEPAVAAAPDGRVTIAWDTYRRGNYDVILRHYQDGKLSPVETVAATPTLEARPAALYDARGRLWLAWEEGDADWGKDYANGITDAGMGLLMRRQVRVACYESGRLLQLPGDLAPALPPEERLAFQRPALGLDGAGNPWVIFRYRTNTPIEPQQRGPEELSRFRTVWRTGAASFQAGAWTRLIEFPGGYGRMEAGLVALGRRDGKVEVAWNSDGRTFPGARPESQDLYTATLEAGPAPAPVEMQPLAIPPITAANPHPDEARDVARLRAYRATLAGKTYRLVRGDMHRHTDLSWDGNRDGSLFDCYRYALDAAAFDYLGVSDHQAGYSQYSWWMLQKAVEMFSIPGRFAPLYGYERSLPYPNGHRNAMFAQAGIPVFPIPEAERKGLAGAAKFYQYLHANHGISMPHTSATGAGTDWRDNDPAVEPLVEIYQGYRNSYEHEGAPRSSQRREKPAGFVWNAWAKGYKIGVQSSSDHVSTHVSYAVLYVTGVTREEILAAIRARRAYAATDNILVDFRLNGHLMGEAFASGATQRLTAHIEGTGAIRKVEVIRNNQYIHTQPGAGASLDFTYVDNAPLAGESYYYIRVEQADGQLAWSSPIWITR